MKHFAGTLELVMEDGKRFWKVTGSQPTMMMKRIMPSVRTSERQVSMVNDNIKNIEYLKWLMVLYPLEIKHKEEWQKSLSHFFKVEKKRESLHTLQRASPGAAFSGKLFDFQSEGLDFMMKTNGNCLLADEMGLGKTASALSFLATEQNTFPALVICPLVVMEHWKNETKRFLRIQNNDGLLQGIETEPAVTKIRTGKTGSLGTFDIYIINYELVAKRRDDIAKLGIRTLIMDEVQNIRSQSTGKYEAIEEIAALSSINYRIGLSGTPIYNRGSEMFSIVEILSPGYLGTWSEFQEEYCWTDFKGRVWVHEDRRAALAAKLRESLLLRRKKQEVLKDLPEKTRITQTIPIDHDYYDDQIEEIFGRLEQETQAIINDPEKKSSRQFEIAAARQRASESERISAGIAKVKHVVKYIRGMMEIDEKIVVFCHHKIVHEILNTELKEFNPCTIIGGQTDNQRIENINNFQNDPKYKLMIAGLRAGNVGINLTSANYVIFAELDWSPAIHRQSEDRLHRIGQKKAVMAHYLVGKDTMDEKIVGVLLNKTLEIDAVMGDKTEIEDTTKSEEIIKNLDMLLQKVRRK